MLAGVVERMLRQRGAAELAPLGAMLPALLSTLAEGIEAEHSAGRPLDTPAVRALLGLVGQLTTGAPQPLRPFLRQVGRPGGGSATVPGKCHAAGCCHH